MPQMARVRVLTGSGTSSRSSLAEIMPAEAKVRTGREISGYYNLGKCFRSEECFLKSNIFALAENGDLDLYEYEY